MLIDYTRLCCAYVGVTYTGMRLVFLVAICNVHIGSMHCQLTRYIECILPQADQTNCFIMAFMVVLLQYAETYVKITTLRYFA